MYKNTPTAISGLMCDQTTGHCCLTELAHKIVTRYVLFWWLWIQLCKHSWYGFCVGINFHFWRRQWQPTPVLLPEKSHGWRNLVGYSPWGRKESDTAERLHFHFLLSCIGEGNGNPLQCSCLENPRDRGAWWAAVYGVAQSWTWLKRLSSSSKLSFHLGK